MRIQQPPAAPVTKAAFFALFCQYKSDSEGKDVSVSWARQGTTPMTRLELKLTLFKRKGQESGALLERVVLPMPTMPLPVLLLCVEEHTAWFV